MRKFLSWLITLVMLLSLGLAVPALAEEKIVLTVLDYADSTAPYRKAATEAWLEKHPNVEVEYTLTTHTQLTQTIMAGINSGDTPDIFMIPDGITPAEAIAQGWYLPLTDYVDRSAFDDFVDGAIVEGKCMLDGKVYMVPESGGDPHCFVLYNKDLWAAAGLTDEDIPKTYSQFREVAKRLTEAGKGVSYGIVEGGTQSDRMWQNLVCWADLSGGFYAVDSYLNLHTGKPDWNTQEIYDVMQLWADLYADGSIHPNTASQGAPDARAEFANGQAGMIIQGWWNVGSWSKDYPELNYGVFAPPVSDAAYEAGILGFVPLTTGKPSMGVSASTKHPELAVSYMMEVICGVEFQSDAVAAGVQSSLLKTLAPGTVVPPVTEAYFAIGRELGRIIPETVLYNLDTVQAVSAFTVPEPTPIDILKGVIAGQITDYKPMLENFTLQATAAWDDALAQANDDGASLTEHDFAFPEWDGSAHFDEAAYEAHREAK